MNKLLEKLIITYKEKGFKNKPNEKCYNKEHQLFWELYTGIKLKEIFDSVNNVERNNSTTPDYKVSLDTFNIYIEANAPEKNDLLKSIDERHNDNGFESGLILNDEIQAKETKILKAIGKKLKKNYKIEPGSSLVLALNGYEICGYFENLENGQPYILNLLEKCFSGCASFATFDGILYSTSSLYYQGSDFIYLQNPKKKDLSDYFINYVKVYHLCK